MKAKQRVWALRGGQPDDLAASEVGCGQIWLRCASMKHKIAPNDPEEFGECRFRAAASVGERRLKK